ncbi:MAG: class I SAM-dependent methyltransferase [Wenzhouxiangella sp.]|jgi:SAM-dependent methyltransferase|nr:class I SAM-dependent methyltransferase [Wenzhouxiangella sp.]
MDEFELLIDLHKGNDRQGPGGDEESELALALARIGHRGPLKIADIGCGTGASTLVLARLLDAEIVAVDFLQDFLDVLDERAEREGLSGKITTLRCEMGSLPFEPEAFDVIWSEGAIYNMGFEKGIAEWRRHLKPGGLLMASEISWLTHTRPAEIQQHWDGEYPEIDTPSAKIGQMEANGYSPIGYFTLPEHCWTDNYYGPLQADFGAFLERHGHSDEAHAIVEAERREIELYSKYKAYYSYGVYVARKVAAEGG